MKIYRIAEELKSIQEVKSLIPQIIEAAQKEYDEWDESNIDEYAGGGICHLIADQIAYILEDFETQTTTDTYEQHVYCLVKVKEGIFVVDIHHSTYEVGAAYSWKKLPDIVFKPNDVMINQIDTNPNNWDNYIEY